MFGILILWMVALERLPSSLIAVPMLDLRGNYQVALLLAALLMQLLLSPLPFQMVEISSVWGVGGGGVWIFS